MRTDLTLKALALPAAILATVAITFWPERDVEFLNQPVVHGMDETHRQKHEIGIDDELTSLDPL